MGDLFKACDAGSVAVSKAPKFDLIALHLASKVPQPPETT
jgi:hypothetical protein